MDLFASQFISENVFVLRVSAHLGGRFGRTITAKEAPFVSTSSAHVRPDIGLSPATPNVPKSEVGYVQMLDSLLKQ